MARHNRRCKEKYRMNSEERADKDCQGNTAVTRQEGQGYVTGVVVSYYSRIWQDIGEHAVQKVREKERDVNIGGKI